MKIVNEIKKHKARLRHGKKPAAPGKLDHFIGINKLPRKLPFSFSKPKRFWPLIIPIAFTVLILWQLPTVWLVQTVFSANVTYPKATVLDKVVGSLDVGQLNTKLGWMKSELESNKITLTSGKNKWAFDASKLGVSFDVPATKQSVLRLNSLNPVDKYRLLTGSISSAITPTITINNDDCQKSLSVINISETKPVDATVYFDSVAKIKPDTPGTKFNAVSTCRELPKRLAANELTSTVYYDIAKANLTKADLEPKLTQIQSMVGKSLTLQGGGYQQTQTPVQLLAMLDISKKGSDVSVSWSGSKLDDLVNVIAGKVNTYDNGPALSGCQYLSSAGGNWLDKTATIKIFTDLGANSSHLYTLPVSYHSPAIGTMSQVPYGSSGTVYLTFDDGMAYANQIMNYAACYGVKVTFFEIGGNATGSDAPALRRAIAEGHAVQSHGHYHAMYDYGVRSLDWQISDIAQSIIDIQSITGVRPTYFRPPGGNHTANTEAAANANGVRMILWGLSSQDSTVGGLSSAQTCANVLAGIYPGASVLMHSTHASTAAAFPCIVEGLAARGYNMQALR